MPRHPSLRRSIIVAIVAWIVFGFVLPPIHLDGKSMEPTYHDGSYHFYWRQSYLFASPARGDVVAIRFAGKKVVLLKRIIGLGGDTIAFENGVLFRNGHPVPEPYVRFRSNWNLKPRKVRPGRLYVVGDNRGVPMNQHHFGQVNSSRILGKVIW
jgi:signal peptidase I